MPLLLVNDAHHMTVERAFIARTTQSFRVVDAETGKPVSEARVALLYNFDWMSDWNDAAVADADGVATLRIATRYLHLLNVSASAPGYITDDHGARDVRARLSSAAGKGSDVPIDIRLYRDRPRGMGLKLPAGFRGTVQYAVAVSDRDASTQPLLSPGQDVWWTDALPASSLTIVQPPPRIGAQSLDWSAARVACVSVGGQPLPLPDPGAAATTTDFAAWHIGYVTRSTSDRGDTHILVVGDRETAVAEASAMWLKYHNRGPGFIYNGWSHVVAPDAVTGPGAYGVMHRLAGEPAVDR